MPDDASGENHQWTSGDLAEEGGGEDDLPMLGHWPHAQYDSNADGSNADGSNADGSNADGSNADGSNAKASRAPRLSLSEAKDATRGHARDMEALLTEAARRHWPTSAPRAGTSEEPPRRAGLHAKALPVLQAVPWLLGALFAASFAWDFPGWSVGAFGYAWPLEGLLRIVSVSGGIGFLTNWLAVTMLFRPRQPRPVFGQGLIPAQKERVAWRLSEAVSEDLLNEDIIKEKIRRSGIVRIYREKMMQTTRAVVEDDAFRQDLKALAEGYARDVLRAPAVQQRLAAFIIERLEAHARGGLGGVALRAWRAWGERDFRRRIGAVVERLPQSVEPALDELDALLDRLPAHLEKRSGRLEDAATRLVLRFVENLDVQQMVRERIGAYDERRLEALFKKTSNEQLNYIKYLGGILGAVGGLVIWAPAPALFLFALVGLLLYTLDETLLRMQKPAAP